MRPLLGNSHLCTDMHESEVKLSPSPFDVQMNVWSVNSGSTGSRTRGRLFNSSLKVYF
jgi:hypothetical protein